MTSSSFGGSITATSEPPTKISWPLHQALGDPVERVAIVAEGADSRLERQLVFRELKIHPVPSLGHASLRASRPGAPLGYASLRASLAIVARPGL
jgi:hypothetical protein